MKPLLLVLLPIAICSNFGSSQAASTAKLPGTLGVYCKDFGGSTNLSATMRQIKAAGIDFILPYAKLTSGKVKWDSQVAPPDLVDSPQYFESVVREAHAAGLKVYPVFCAATEGGDTRANALLQRNPDWAFHVEGKPIGYIDPGNPEARKYEVDLITELVSKYPVDGLSLDYLRTPNRLGYTQTARRFFLARRKVDLATLTGGTPEKLDTEGGAKSSANTASAARAHSVWPEYKKWRQQQLNLFMSEIRSAVNKARPGLPISTYCWGAHTYTGNFETCQDWKTWIRSGWLDWINPSGYRYTDEAFLEVVRSARENIPQGFPFYVTIGVTTSHGKLPDVAAIKQQMQVARAEGADGLVFFTWEALQKFLPDVAEPLKSWEPLNPATR